MNPDTQALIRTIDSRQRIQNIRLNVVLTESHNITNVVTRAPVDGEADRAQHVISQPKEVAITAIVSKHTDSYDDMPEARFVAQTNFEFGQPNGYLTRPQGNLTTDYSLEIIEPEVSAVDTHATFWARINALNDSKELFDYTSDLGVYRNMVFDSIEVIRDEREWIEFSAIMIEFVLSGVTRDRWLSEDQLNDSGDPGNPGTKTTKDADFEALLPDVTAKRVLPQATQSSEPPE